MERIVIEVDKVAGDAYRKFSPENKKQFDKVVSILLKKTKNDSTITDYKKLLDEIGYEAMGNGLTPDILNDLLKHDD